MRSVVRSSLFVFCGMLCAPLVAAAQFRMESGDVVFPPPGTPFGGPGMRAFPGYMIPGRGRPVRSPRRSRPQQPKWDIPVGEYGLELADGTRMVGRPAKDWSARIATAFGTVTIPLTQIAHIAPAKDGQFAAYLKNGDRVTGTLVSRTMRFETKFGTLSVAATHIARLRSSNPATVQPVSTTSRGPSSRPTRRRPGAAGRIRIDSIPMPAGGFPAPKE